MILHFILQAERTQTSLSMLCALVAVVENTTVYIVSMTVHNGPPEMILGSTGVRFLNEDFLEDRPPLETVLQHTIN
jgi:hypothetical protein